MPRRGLSDPVLESQITPANGRTAQLKKELEIDSCQGTDRPLHRKLIVADWRALPGLRPGARCIDLAIRQNTARSHHEVR